MTYMLPIVCSAGAGPTVFAASADWYCTGNIRACHPCVYTHIYSSAESLHPLTDIKFNLKFVPATSSESGPGILKAAKLARA